MILNCLFIVAIAVATWAFPTSRIDETVSSDRIVDFTRGTFIYRLDSSSESKLIINELTGREIKALKYIPQNAPYDPDQIFKVISIIEDIDGKLKKTVHVTPTLKKLKDSTDTLNERPLRVGTLFLPEDGGKRCQCE